MNWFHSFFDRFTGAVRVIFSFILPIAESDAGDIISKALPLALSIVTAIGQQGLKGDDARSAALEQLKTQITQQGIADATSLATSTLNFIIESAVSNLRATKNA